MAKLIARILVSMLVSGVFIFISLRNADLGAVWSSMANAAPGPILGYLAILLVVHVVKTLRWGLLLRPLGKISFSRLNSASAVGFMLMMTLPLRLGELARPLIVSRPVPGSDQRLQRTGALASIVVERIIDSLAVGVLAIVSLRLLATTGNAADIARHAATLVTVAFAALCLGLVIAYFMRLQTVALVRRLLGVVSRKLADKVAHMLDGFIRGLHLGSSLSVIGVLVLTVVYWILHIVGFAWVAQAFGLQLTTAMATTVLACQVVGFMIPSGPGNIGPSQAATQFGVSIFLADGFQRPEVIGYANTIWALQFGQQVLLGLVFLMIGHVSLTGLFKAWDKEPVPAEAAPPGQSVRIG
jgi:glycosyltransferase 2 family protein